MTKVKSMATAPARSGLRKQENDVEKQVTKFLYRKRQVLG